MMQAQENLAITGANLSPSPLATVENYGAGCITFNIINVSLPGYDSAATEIKIEFDKIAPKDGINSITSSFDDLSKFEWEYNLDSNTMRGVQIDAIGSLYSEKITICCDVIENSSCDSLESVGFAVEGFVLSGSDGNINDNFSSVFTCTLESISSVENNNELDSNLTVFPNPTSGCIYIESDIVVDRVEVYNFLGKLVAVAEYTKDGIQLNDMPNGYYMCRILSVENKLISVKEIYLSK